MAQVVLINQTANNLSYVNGQVLISANNQANVSFGLVPYLVLDPNFKSDLSNRNVVVSDSVTTYSSPSDALDFLSMWVTNGPPQNANDPVTFTLAGLGFSTTGSATVSNSTETPVLLLSNPINSGTNCRAIYFYSAPNSTQGIVTINIYSNPTISSNGTPITISNNLVSNSAPSSAMNAYGGPTISSNGTKRITVVTNANADTSLFNFAQTAILAPGNSMLMTVVVSNIGLLASVTTYFYLQWVEA